MEDAFAVALSFLASEAAGGEQEQELDFFAVYDGHGGARVAEACRERMHVVLAEEVGLRRRRSGSDDLRWEEAMAASFARVDGEVTGGLSSPHHDDAGSSLPYRTVGSTAVVAVVGRRRIVVGNCGDSRAVLSRGGVAVPLSSDHKVRTSHGRRLRMHNNKLKHGCCRLGYCLICKSDLRPSKKRHSPIRSNFLTPHDTVQDFSSLPNVPSRLNHHDDFHRRVSVSVTVTLFQCPLANFAAGPARPELVAVVGWYRSMLMRWDDT